MSFPSELSQHTELLLLASSAEKSVESPRNVRCLDQLNRWLADHNHSDGFWEVSSYAGGSKPMASLVFAATFFDFRFSPFMEFLRELPWCEPERVQLLVREEGMERFAIFTKFLG